MSKKETLKRFAKGGAMQNDRLFGSVRLVDGKPVYDLQLAPDGITEDKVILICETKQEKEYFDQADLSNDIEKWRELRLFERMTGGKHELADLDL